MDSVDLLAAPDRRAKLGEAERKWLDYATRERGYHVRPNESGVTKKLAERYEERKRQYLSGEIGLRIVYEAFVDYANSTREYYYVSQLEGEAYKPGIDGERGADQRTLHLMFQKGGEPGKMQRVFRKTVTPQVEMMPDQLERAAVYFHLDPMEYAEKRATMRRQTK
jgi:hypothetical protein